jgi:hypothetical protein
MPLPFDDEQTQLETPGPATGLARLSFCNEMAAAAAEWLCTDTPQKVGAAGRLRNHAGRARALPQSPQKVRVHGSA